MYVTYYLYVRRSVHLYGIVVQTSLCKIVCSTFATFSSAIRILHPSTAPLALLRFRRHAVQFEQKCGIKGEVSQIFFTEREENRGEASTVREEALREQRRKKPPSEEAVRGNKNVVP